MNIKSSAESVTVPSAFVPGFIHHFLAANHVRLDELLQRDVFRSRRSPPCNGAHTAGAGAAVLAGTGLIRCMWHRPTCPCTNDTHAHIRLRPVSSSAVDVYTSSTVRPLKHTLTNRDEQTFLKLVVDGETNRVLGCHMVGAEAGEIIQGFAVALKCGATKAQFDATIGIHPMRQKRCRRTTNVRGADTLRLSRCESAHGSSGRASRADASGGPSPGVCSAVVRSSHASCGRASASRVCGHASETPSAALVAVAVAVSLHLAGKRGEQIDEIPDRQRDRDHPPDQTDPQRDRGGGGVEHRQ
jgi:hypothetical protein